MIFNFTAISPSHITLVFSKTAEEDLLLSRKTGLGLGMVKQGRKTILNTMLFPVDRDY